MSDAVARFFRRRDGLALAALLAATVVVFFPVASMQRFFYHYDTHYYFYSHRALAAETVKRGELPLWNPYAFSGMPLAGDGQTALLYPPNWVFLVVPAPEALNAVILFHFWLAAAGTYLFSRAVGLTRLPALVGAVSFGFGGYPIARVVHLSILGGAALIPWVFLCVEMVVRAGSARWVAWTGVAVALQVLAGHPQLPTYTGFAAAVYAVARAASGPASRRWWLSAGRVAAGYATGFCLAAAALLPWAELAAESPRAAGTSFEFVFQRSMRPADWLLFFFPRLYGSLQADAFGSGQVPFGRAIRIWELSAYVGILPLALSAVGLLRPCGRVDATGVGLTAPPVGPPGIRLPLALVLIGAAVMAAGKATPVANIVYSVPVVGKFRDPARALALASFSLAVLAGVGLQHLQTIRNWLPRGHLQVLAVALAITAIPCIAVSGASSPGFQWLSGVGWDELSFLRKDGPNAWVPVVLSAVAAGLLIWWATTGAGWTSGWLALAFVSMDVGYFAATFNPTTDRSFYEYQPDTLTFLRKEGGEFRKATFLPTTPKQEGREARELLTIGWPLAYQVEDINGFNSLQTRRYTDYVFSPTVKDVSYGRLANPRLLAAGDPVLNSLNVKYVITSADRLPPLGEHLRLVHRNDAARVYLNTTCWPRAFFPAAVASEPDVDRLLHCVTAPGYDARQKAYIEGGAPPPAAAGATAATIIRKSNYKIEVATVNDTPGLLMLSEMYAPGWRAYIDTTEVPVLRVNYLFRGVVVPSGHHTVRLVYRPVSLLVGCLISITSCLIVVVAVLLWRRVEPLLPRSAAGGPPALSVTLADEGFSPHALSSFDRPDVEERKRIGICLPIGEARRPLYSLSRDPDGSHYRVARLALSIGRSPLLDVGSAQGVLGDLLTGTGLKLDAVEPDATTGIGDNPNYRVVYPSSVEVAQLPEATYPVVVCADILEHAADPPAVLRRLQRAATADAIFLISLPNVGHLSARPFTLVGWYPRMRRGIFDRTHRHFYTRETAGAMIRAGGLEIVTAFPTPVPLEKVWPNCLPALWLQWLMRLQRLAVRMFPNLLGYQWVFVASPFNMNHFDLSSEIVMD